MNLSRSLDNLSNLRAQPMYSTKNCVNGAETHSLSRRLRFGPANQVSPYDCSIPFSETNIPFFYDPIALTQATENPYLQTLDYDALSYVIRHSCHLLCSRVNGSAAQLVPFTRQPCRANGLVPNTRQVVERTGGRANGSERILNIERTLGLQSLRTTNVMIKATKYFRLERKGTPVIFLFGWGAHQVDSLLGKPCRPTNPCSIIKNPPVFLSPNYSEHLPSSHHSSFQRTPKLPTYLKITATRPATSLRTYPPNPRYQITYNQNGARMLSA